MLINCKLLFLEIKPCVLSPLSVSKPPPVVSPTNTNNILLNASLDGNLDLCKLDTCEKKQRSFPIPVIASVISVSVLLLLSIITIFWRLKRGEFFLFHLSSFYFFLSFEWCELNPRIT